MRELHQKSIFRLVWITTLFITIQGFVQASEHPEEIETDDAIEEIIISGTSSQELSSIDEKTERLFSIAGAADDPLQAIYSFPGVTFSEDGEPIIRGSSPRDNIFYVDLIPAGYLYHIFGNSTLNKNLIRSFELYPSAFPSQFGNATGGVIDVKLRHPKSQPFTTTFNWSFLVTGLMVESALTKNQAFYASYRRSLIDQFYDRFYSEEDKDNDKEDEGFAIDQFPVAQDYQIKYTYSPNNNNNLSFVAAGANDDLEATFNENNDAVARDPDLSGPLGFDQGYDNQGIIWNWSSDLKHQRLNTRFTHSRDYLDLDYGINQHVNTLAENSIFRSDYKLHITDNHWLTTGISYNQSLWSIDFNAKILSCSEFDPDCETVDADYQSYNDKITVNSRSLFLEDLFSIKEQFWVTLGLHYSADNYLHEQRTEPRLQIEYLFTENWTTYFSTGRYSQLPELDKMIPVIGNPQLKTEKANHYVWGLEQQLNYGWNWKTDLYYKDKYDVVISVTDKSHPDFDLNYTNKAKGKAYGLELVINKNITEKWYGWLALSLSKAEQTSFYTHKTTPFQYDKPVILDLVFNHLLTERWMMGIKWSIESGALYTPIIDLEPSQTNPDILKPVYGDQNSERLPYYHRLDFRAEYKAAKSWGYWSFHIDVINAYNQTNIVGYEYTPTENDTTSSQPGGYGKNVPVTEQTAEKIFPSLGFEVQF